VLSRVGSLEQPILQRRLAKKERERVPMNQTPCIHFQRRGHCREGDRCRFMHNGVCPLDKHNAQQEKQLRARLEAFRGGATTTHGENKQIKQEQEEENTQEQEEEEELVLEASLNSFERKQVADIIIAAQPPLTRREGARDRGGGAGGSV
jgi:hypothetical protein